MQINNSVYLEQHIPTPKELFWRNFSRNNVAYFSLWLLGFLCLITLLAPWISPFPPDFKTDQMLLPPSWSPVGSIEYFLGTDAQSHDMLSRLIAGSRLTFGYAVLTTLAASLIGVIIGIVAGMTSGMLSSVLNHLLDAVLSIPSILLAIIIVAFWGPSEASALFAVWLALIPRFIRSTYVAVAEEMKKEYILAARLDGENSFYILYHSVLPNILFTLTTEVTRGLSVAILDIAALGFLGLSEQGNFPEWGAMLSESSALIFVAPWTVTLPGVAIMGSVVLVNTVGDGIAEAINLGTE